MNNRIRKIFNKFNKKSFLKHSWILGLGVVPIVASSCGVSSALVNNSYIVTSNNFTSSLSLSDVATASLKWTTGMSSFLKAVVDRVLYNWLVNLSLSNSDYKALLDNEITTVNSDYENSIKDYKNKYQSNWQLKFQQEVLDPVGGTKQSYINNKLYAFARTTFTDKLFSTFYLTIFDESTNQVELYPTASDILDALINTAKVSDTSIKPTNANLKFKFDNQSDLTSDANSQPDKWFANFQDFIFQKYVEYENPYVVDNVQWNYSTPSGGINSLYKISSTSSDGSDSSGDGSTTTTTNALSISRQDDTTIGSGSSDGSDSGDSGGDTSTALPTIGSYAFPYFGNENSTNETNGTVDKFTNFLANSATSKNYMTNNNLGLKSIPVTYSDGTSTATLVKNNTLYNDQSAEYAAATSYLYGVLGQNAATGTNNSANQMTDIKSQITHNIDLSTVNADGLDKISQNFISASSLYNTATTTTSTIETLQLPKEYMANIINPNGNLKTLATKDVYVIDNFIPGTVKTSATSTDTSTPLDEYMLFRSSKGVEAVSIDGSTLINKATSVQDKKTKAGLVVLYRYFMGQQPGATFTIDLKTELSNFLNANIDWLIYQYLSQTSIQGIDGSTITQSLLTKSEIDSLSQKLAEAISYFSPALSFYNSTYTAAQQMYTAKKVYNQNYGYSAYQNGLVSNFNYSYGSVADARNNLVNPNMFYENTLLASTANNPYSTILKAKNANLNTNGTTTLYANVIAAISPVVSQLTNQVADYDKYSQYLSSNNYFVNNAMNSALANTTIVTNMIQDPILSNYIGNFYSISSTSDNNTFSLSSNPFNAANSADNTTNSDLQTYLQSAMYNFYFSTNITSEANSMFSFGSTINTQTVTNTTAKDTLTSMRKYSWDLWNNQNLDFSSQLNNYNTLYKLVASVKYLLGSDLSNFLQYMQDYIGKNNQAFVVWQNSVNTKVAELNNTSYSIPTSQSLITQASLATNTSNSVWGNYVGKSSTTATTTTPNKINQYNLLTSNTYQSTINTSYYVATDNLAGNESIATNSVNVGFAGLKLATNNSLPTDVSNALFVSPFNYNIDNQGLLYQYNSKDNLIALINSKTTANDLSTLATDLDKLTDYQFNFTNVINTDKSINDKKLDFINVVNSLSDNLFTQYKGFVGDAITSSGTTTINAYSEGASVSKYGTYAIQLNADSFSSLSTLQSALGATANDPNSYKAADEIICNLVVQFASQSLYQSYWMPSIVGDNKISVYDIRAYNAFSNDALVWLNNYKVITPSSDSDSSSS